MSTSFYNFDHYIEANEKRDTAIRTEYDKTISRVSNILIIYTGISAFLVSICKDFFSFPFNIWYFTALMLFGILFLISFVYAIRFLFPIVIPFLRAPKKYFGELRSELEATLSNESELTDDIKERINQQIKNSYLEELKGSIDFNSEVVTRKQGYYNKALKHAIFCIFPFIICVIFYLSHK
ncbi:hypothetical protein SIO70_01140 [Chitinophaga sancti]|uniref:hypothetical protein n=1 Tax=Chitinophaga sancti TaxID=1004 RepID=UPI002A75326F|nr:hypothetical protein [Chitinophaga sancti]WPQ63468.1 hypothetical protein SIO70_01140 [Chitinophaga sancti]